MSDAITTGPLGLLLSDDLIFTSRITAAGRTAGLTVRAARSAAALADLTRQQCPTCVILDLGNPGLDLAELLDKLRAACPRLPRVVAYGSHVDAAGLRAARAAGCDIVLPRSAFVEQLPRELPAWLAPP